MQAFVPGMMIALLGATCAACTTSPVQAGQQESSPVQPKVTPGTLPERVPSAPGTGGDRVVSREEGVTPIRGEVPQTLLAKIREDLQQRIGSAAADAEVVRAEAVEWPNGALGCPEPGQLYTQAIVPGYRVDLVAGEVVYSYHASQRGYFKLCPAGQSKAPRERPGRELR